jgi:hypothetical protein
MRSPPISASMKLVRQGLALVEAVVHFAAISRILMRLPRSRSRSRARSSRTSHCPAAKRLRGPDISVAVRRRRRASHDDVSLRIRKRIEEAFGWIKTVAGQERTKFRGRERVGWAFTFAAAAFNLARLPKLMEALA